MIAAERIFRRCGAPQFSTSNFMVFRGGPNGEEVCPLNQKSRTVKYLSHTFTYVQLSCRLRRYTPIISLARRVTSIVLFSYPFNHSTMDENLLDGATVPKYCVSMFIFSFSFFFRWLVVFLTS